MLKKILFGFIFSLCLLSAANALQKKPIIVFDFGGVIGSFNVKVYEDYLLQNLPITKEELAELRSTFRTKVEKKRMPLGEFWTDYAALHGKDWPENWREIVEQGSLSAFYVFDDVMEVVYSLQEQGYQTAMLSNVKDYVAEGIRKRGFYEPFEPLLLSCEIGLIKPDPKIYEFLLERLNVSAHECIFIDDKMENIEAANMLGIDGIHFHSAEKLAEEFQKRGITVFSETLHHQEG